MGVAANVANAKRFADSYAWLFRIWREQGSTLQSIADAMNSLGWAKRGRGRWSSTTILRIINAAA
jgi:hypothetical protein